MDDTNATFTNHSFPHCQLLIENGEHEGMVIPMRDTVVSVGRGPDNTIQIIDQHMSRNHTLLILNNKHWIVRDLGSKNGTLINEQSIESDVRLNHDDVLQIGDTCFRFQEEVPRARHKKDTTTGLRVLDDDQEVTPRQMLKMPSNLVEVEEASEELAVGSAGPGSLNVLNQVADMISSVLDLDELLDRVTDLIQEFLSPDRAGVLLYDEEYEVLLPKVIRRPENATDDIVISNSIITKAVTDRVAILVGDAPRDNRFQASESIVRQRIQSAICAPLAYKEEVLGVLYIDRHYPNTSFTDADLKLVAVIANQASLAIANSRLHNRLLTQHTLDREMEIARTIQENLLPATMPNLQNFELGGMCLPARMVGGDYYDIIELPDGRWVIAIADVSGKGVPAAILLASVRAAVQIESRSLMDHGLLEIIDRVNQMVCRDSSNSMFVTMVLGLLDPARRTFEFVNAGHVYPMLFKGEAPVRMLESGGCFLGVMPEITYKEEKVSLEAGSTLVMYSDGVTDVMNAEGEMFGNDRLKDDLQAVSDQSAQQICEHIRRQADTFRGTAEPFDDFTILTIKSLG